MSQSDDLQEFRQSISQVDQEILALFHKRQSLVKDVALYKQARGMTIFQPDQEQRKLEDLTQGLDENTANQVRQLFECLFAASRQKQSDYYGEFGLLGQTLRHSFSPQIHQAFNRYSYRLWEQTPDQVADFLKERPFVGLNVTIPYKETVLAYLDQIDPLAKAIGAVNTIIHRQGQLIGYNTDYQGFESLLQEANISLKGKRVLILGHGGAAKMVAYYAQSNGASQVQQISLRQPITNYESEILDSQVIINATPVAMYPNNLEEGLDLALFEQLEAVVDLIYNPLNTPILQAAQARGLQTANGLWMLVAQAFYAGQLFTDQVWSHDSLAESYQYLYAQAQNIVLIGMPGAGKTTIGQVIAERLNRPFIDSDQEIEQLEGLTVTQVFEQKGEAYFRKLETQVLKALSSRTGCVIATGGGSVMKEENRQALKQNGFFVYLDLPLDQLAQAGRPLSKNPEVIQNLYQTRYKTYQALADCHLQVVSDIEINCQQLMTDLKAYDFWG